MSDGIMPFERLNFDSPETIKEDAELFDIHDVAPTTAIPSHQLVKGGEKVPKAQIFDMSEKVAKGRGTPLTSKDIKVPTVAVEGTKIPVPQFLTEIEADMAEAMPIVPLKLDMIQSQAVPIADMSIAEEELPEFYRKLFEIGKLVYPMEMTDAAHIHYLIERACADPREVLIQDKDFHLTLVNLGKQVLHKVRNTYEPQATALEHMGKMAKALPKRSLARQCYALVCILNLIDTYFTRTQKGIEKAKDKVLLALERCDLNTLASGKDVQHTNLQPVTSTLEDGRSQQPPARGFAITFTAAQWQIIQRSVASVLGENNVIVTHIDKVLRMHK